jgi:hypothetical protein
MFDHAAALHAARLPEGAGGGAMLVEWGTVSQANGEGGHLSHRRLMSRIMSAARLKLLHNSTKNRY